MLGFDVFLALGGVVGSYAMLKDSSGKILGLPLISTTSIPFIKSYLLPGMFILSVYVLGGSLAAFATGAGYAWAGTLNVCIGSVLMVWVMLERAFIAEKNFLEPFFFTIGLMLVLVGFFTI